MKLIEADGKKLLRDAGIAVPLGRLFAFDDDPQSFLATMSYPLYVKAQLLQGRRGSTGLVCRAATAEAAAETIVKIRTAVGERPCAGVLLEAEIPHLEEWFLSVEIDRESEGFRVAVSDQGGASVSSAAAHLLADATEIVALLAPHAVQEVARKLVAHLEASDALSIEINPLAILADGSCVALDAKVELDDAAAFRHPEWSEVHRLPELGRALFPRELAYARSLEHVGYRGTLGRYVELDGDIALILSGGGASLVALDALRRAGGRPANYVEMSGNPDPELVCAASKIVFSKPELRAVWIAGSHANFTDIQATVNATLAAADELKLRVPIVIRRDGPNVDASVQDATRWAAERGISLRFNRADTDLDASAHAVVAASKPV